MANAPWFARPRAVKLIASLCVLCALAFMLGQETAAYRAVQLQLQTSTATSHSARAIPAISTAAAQGSKLAPTVFIAGAGHPAADDGHANQRDKHGKQHGPKHHAAGDSSHGGMIHHRGDSNQRGSHGHDG